MIKNSFILLSYLLLSILSFYAPVSLKSLLVVIFIFFPIFCGAKYCTKESKIFLTTIVLTFVFYAIRLLNFRFSLAGLYIVSNIIIANFVFKNSFNLKIIKFAYILVSLFYIILAFKGLPLDSYFVGASRNLISVILLVFVSVIYILEQKQNIKFSFWPLIPLNIVSILAVGRGGIVCSLLLTVAFMMSKLNNRRRIVLALILLFIPLVLYWDDIVIVYDTLFAKSRFAAEGLASDERDILMSIYIDNMNFKTFCLGYDYYSDSFYQSFDFNSHNSYIKLHHFMGIFSFLIVIFFIYSIFKLLKKDFFMCSLMIVMLLRGYVDNVYFFDKYDFVLYTLCLISLNSTHNENTIPSQI